MVICDGHEKANVYEFFEKAIEIAISAFGFLNQNHNESHNSSFTNL